MPDKKPTQNAIEVRNLDFYYGNFKGLKNVNLNIAEHRVTAFIGPSGCGKSTLLRTFNRMYSLIQDNAPRVKSTSMAKTSSIRVKT